MFYISSSNNWRIFDRYLYNDFDKGLDLVRKYLAWDGSSPILHNEREKVISIAREHNNNYKNIMEEIKKLLEE